MANDLSVACLLALGCRVGAYTETKGGENQVAASSKAPARVDYLRPVSLWIRLLCPPSRYGRFTKSVAGKPEPEPLEKQGEVAASSAASDQSPAAGFRRVPNQKGVGEGEIRLYCEACQKSFTTSANEPVGNCPEGHSPDTPRDGEPTA